MNNLKKYHEYSDDISDDELFDGLLGQGLFADKLPNFLTSLNFLEYCRTIELPFETKKKGNDYIRYLSMRNINVPREMGIPDPFAYANKCRILSNNWDKLQAHFIDKTKNENHKVSRVHLRKTKNKSSLFEMNYKNFKYDGEPAEELAINNTYIAVADISNCFPSVYSHSIPWALVGKAKAKEESNDKKAWFNDIDFRVRNVKHGETNGLLIGPHASNLISEIILVAVDESLVKKGYKYVRHIDDYTCYVHSADKADSFMIDLSEELKKYGLSLNHKKSKIIPILKGEINNWRNKLKHFNFIDTFISNDGRNGIKVKELKAYLDFSIELMIKEDSNTAVINYAIKQIKDKYLGKSAQSYYLKKIHHLALLYPYLIQYLEECVFDIHNIESSIIKKIATDIYNYGVHKKIYEASSYALHWSLKYDFLLDHTNIKDDAIESLDCIFMLIAYKYNIEKQLKQDNEYKRIAAELKKSDFDKYWLFIYEVLPHNELNDEFKKLKKNKITFIKPTYKQHKLMQRGDLMPEISRFFGMVVFMYWDEHNPPHFHVKYGGQQAAINIRTLEIIEGKLNRRATELVLDWAELHQTELIENWDKCALKQKPNKIDPLN